ncbi:unnamed protein product [Linum tenue]|uniref:DELLA protein n=1 Tax=Linum tenue TaxID=586396 RepID=A0AAV0S458_9ROSI|nr:unnamed protein product [Linum tenue]
MMQALASWLWDRPVEMLRIKPVAPKKIITVYHVLDLREEIFNSDCKEALVVYSEFYLRSLVPCLDRMEGLMKVIRGLKPRIVVVLEMESNHNLTTLSPRFVKDLFSFTSVFDFLELSAMVLYHAKLVLKEFPCGKYCKTRVDGKSLIVGWKETPMISISSWKFVR